MVSLKQENRFNLVIKKNYSFDEISNRRVIQSHDNHTNLKLNKKTNSKKKKKIVSKKTLIKQKHPSKEQMKDNLSQENYIINKKQSPKVESNEEDEESEEAEDEDDDVIEDEDVENIRSSQSYDLRENSASKEKNEENLNENKIELQKSNIFEKYQQLNSYQKLKNSDRSILPTTNKDYMSNFIFNKYSIHLKLLNNFNKYNELFLANEKTIKINDNLNQQNRTNPTATFGKNNSIYNNNRFANISANKSCSSHEDSTRPDEQISIKKVLYRTTLSTANSKPLLSKRIQSASNNLNLI